MASEKIRTSQQKAKKDLKVAEIVYYSIGGLALFVGLVFSMFGVILLNPIKENFEDHPLKIAQDAFFNWLKIDTTFAQAGLVLMACAVIYFLIVFAIFAKKGDEVSRRDDLKKSRQRQVVFNAPAAETTVIETEAKEKSE